MFLKNKLCTALCAIFLILNFNQSKAMTAMTKKPDLTFKRHDFGVACYNASDLRVVYAGIPYVREGECRDRIPYDEKRIKATTGGIIAFVGPVDVKWKSKDGQQHEYQLDMDEIFKVKQVLHHEKIEDLIIKDFPYTPDIYVEVDDRTLNVYMDVLITVIPYVTDNGTKRYGRRNVTLAFTKTF